MGKTKTAFIDDSMPQVEEKPARKKINPNPELVDSSKNQEASPRKKINPNPESLKKEAEVVVPESEETPELDNSETITVGAEPEKKTKKAKKPKQGKKIRSKKYEARVDALDEKLEKEIARSDEDEEENYISYKSKIFPVETAIDLAKESSYSKFEGTLELHITTSLKNMRGLVSLPFKSGKALKVLAFGKGAEESGADLIGDDAALAEIEKGRINFDVLVTTPALMPKLARAAKVLGPRGLMPNPKNGTISDDLKKAVSEIQSGKVEYKTERNAPVIHLGIGKVNQATDEISQNIKLLLNSIGKTKIKKAVVTPTMGLGIRIDTSKI